MYAIRSYYGELAEQQLLGQGPFNVLLDDARHGSRAHLLVVTARGHPIACCRLELDRHVVLVELRLELDDELVDDSYNFV